MPTGLDGHPNPIVTPARTAVLRSVRDRVVSLRTERPILVGIDGASGTGKSTFADELVRQLTTTGRPLVRASIDSFHRPRADRYRQGKGSPEGYYRDSHDLAALKRELLDPMRGKGSFRTEVFDEPTDQPLRRQAQAVVAGTILIFDGLFLHRPELVEYWDLGLFLTATTRRECAWQDYLTRDLPSDAGARAEEVADRISKARRPRYTEGWALYEREANPRHQADLVIDNDDLSCPCVVTGHRSAAVTGTMTGPNLGARTSRVAPCPRFDP